jgi:hypothetical protein
MISGFSYPVNLRKKFRKRGLDPIYAKPQIYFQFNFLLQHC